MRDQGLRKTVEEWWDNHGADGGMSAKVGLLPPPIPSSSSNPPSNENDRPTNRLDDATLRAAARKARIDPLPIRAEANALADQVWRTVEEAARQD